MAVEFEFTAGKNFHFTSAFASRFDAVVKEERVYLPDTLGDGFIQEVYPKAGISLCIHNYVLKEEFVLKRLTSSSDDILTFKFDCRTDFKSNGSENGSFFSGKNTCEVEFSTGNFFTELIIPKEIKISFLVISISRQTLLDLLHLEEGCPIEKLLKHNKSFVLHEEMNLQMQSTLKEITKIDETTRLATLLYQIKAHELIYQLFAKLISRSESKMIPVDQADADQIYLAKMLILKDLSVPPELGKLAENIGMSLTKMKQLYRQVFGDSIYNYYQTARMNEAARLLQYLSVSETGYRLGFSNLSHFARLFEKFHKVKPKRFKDDLKNERTGKVVYQSVS
ncbi:helix-turn-helix domain-containing protein [Dyadobacter frigoris]|uniref:Helix-turn-helix transcriptional regulator n=1 Tax=Dyadobacter frigoris TaxID=2576211 RepID=A0A4U6D334_9BACT|nr:AraC family transcriptional regulator [Dyadobacter frigoris]TKT90511.1 helix-turn-helix transcriptional regulator [Dyadobacter frigoris]GLU51356.1 AraC family transcriptional regulator [Dyadobacter frigoris]